MSHPFRGTVIQVDLREFYLIRVQGLRIYTEPVILGGDDDPPRGQIFNRLIRPPVTEFQLEGLSPESQSQELVAETYSEDRFLPEELPGCLNGVGNSLRISWSIG